MKNHKKAHLLYLTGLSVDKKRMNNITENINFDKDFTFWLTQTKKHYNDVTEPINNKLLNGEKITRHLIKKVLTLGMDDLVEIGSNTVSDYVEDSMNSKIDDSSENIIDKSIKPVTSFAFKLFGLTSDEDLSKNHIALYSIWQNMQKKQIQYHNGDFFSLYLANQSDSIGLIPLAKISNDKQFDIEHAYCDWDYYDNKYIDHIILKIEKNKFSNENYEDEINKTFLIHFYDILLSKIIRDSKIEIDKNNVTKESKSLIDLALKSNDKYNKSDLLDMLSERNFFGIALLSQILYTVNHLINDDIYIDIDNREEIEKEFLKELLEMSSNPDLEIDNNTDIGTSIGARIYFSDGISILNTKVKEKEIINTLYNDEYFKNISINLKDKKYTEEQKKNLIKNEYLHTVSYDNKNEISLYISTDYDDEYVYIKVPIKMMLSLPIDSLGNPSNTVYLPDCLSPNNDTIDVITVGGAEHNRALAHLINKHRKTHKNDRLFGFMDNYFDFEYKLQIDEKDSKYKHNFFMGINQPVSGWNYYLSQRHDNNEGESINSSIKYLHYKLNTGKQKINIVSIYGFSAISSVLAIHMFIAELLARDRKNGGSLFEGVFSEYFQKIKLEKNEDCTQAIFLNKDALKIKNEIIYDKFKGLCYLRQFNKNKNIYQNILFKDRFKIIKDITDGRVSTS